MISRNSGSLTVTLVPSTRLGVALRSVSIIVTENVQVSPSSTVSLPPEMFIVIPPFASSSALLDMRLKPLSNVAVSSGVTVGSMVGLASGVSVGSAGMGVGVAAKSSSLISIVSAAPGVGMPPSAGSSPPSGGSAAGVGVGSASSRSDSSSITMPGSSFKAMAVLIST